MYEIQRDIPITSRRKYPVDGLNVGDSFFVPFSDLPQHKNRSATIRSVVRRHSKETGKKFRVATEETGVRVWRVI